MNRYFLLCSLLVFGFACAKTTEKMPLDEAQLVAVLSDMHLAEAILQSVPSADRDSLGRIYYRIIYRTHGITEEDFDKSMAILREDPVRLEAVYAQIVENYSTEEAENQATLSSGVPEQDSVETQ